MNVKQDIATVHDVVARVALLAYDAVFVLSLFLVWTLAIPTPAQAYVDPSVMTYTIQALAGVAVALSAVIGVMWRRLRRHAIRLLKIDDKREKEAEVHYYADGVVPAVAQIEAANVAANLSQTSKQPRMSWIKRLLLALIPSFACSLSLLFFSPLEMIVGAESQLAFKTASVWGIMFLIALGCGLVLALMLSVFWGKGYAALLTLVSACTFGMFLQSLLLNTGLPEATGIAVLWGSFRFQMLINAVIWALIIAAFFVVAHKFKNLSSVLQLALCVVLVLVQTVSLVAGVVAANSNNDSGRVRMTEEGLFTVSKKKNTIVFILDTFDTEDMLCLQSEQKNTLAAFDGFTFYNNSSGKMIPTRYAIPYLLSGVQPTKDETFSNWCRTMYDRSSFLSDIKNAGYSIGVYSDDGSVHFPEKLADKTVNIHKIEGADINPKGAIKVLTKCGIYKSAPWMIKPFFWFYQDELNENIVDQSRVDPANVPYVEKDGAFHEKLVERKLSASDEGQNGAFRFIHLLGTHAPYVLNDKGFQTGKSDIDAQARGSLKIVADYIQQLKDLGVYDNTTIIVTADHGRFDFTASWCKDFNPKALASAGLTNGGKDIGRTTCPIWLVKPAQSAQEDALPCKTSDVPTGHEDYAATVIDSVGGDYSKYGTPTWMVGPEPRVRTYFETIHNASDKVDIEIQEYEIRGDANNFDNWKKTGQIWSLL